MPELELPRREDNELIGRLQDQIETLEDQIKALKKWIKYNTDVDIEIDGLIEEMDGLLPDQQIMTTEELEYYIKKIEMYSDVFSYGRMKEKKMAESL